MLWDTMSLCVAADTSVNVTSHSDEAHLRREAHLRSEAHLRHPHHSKSERRSVSGHHQNKTLGRLGWPTHNHDFATKDNGSLNAFSAWGARRAGTHSDGKVHSESDEECEDHDNVEPHAAKRIPPPFYQYAASGSRAHVF